MLPLDHLQEIIISESLLDQAKWGEALVEAKLATTDVESFLIQEKWLTEVALYQAAAKYYRLPFVDLQNKVVEPAILVMIPEHIASQSKMISFYKFGSKLRVATCLPPDLQMIDFIERSNDAQVDLFFSTQSGINNAINQYRKDIQSELVKIDFAKAKMDVIKVVDAILENAIKDNASDIHIEPKANKSDVLHRIDGLLRRTVELPKDLHAGIVNRVKNLAHLKVEEHRLPQDGRYKMVGPTYNVSIRVSIVPLIEGEKVVMRILHQEKRFDSFENLGFFGRALNVINRQMKKSQGTILVVGPTGSGKTTTLYTLLNQVNTPETNTSTIEDPIEYSFPDMNQSQVKPQIGYTFAAGLRAFLRQDPDIIMVGEIRDEETAEIALQAALTGHLVFSTLHTNDASSTMPRLLEMKIPPYLIASTIHVIIAQRLIRTLCKDCKKKSPSPQSHLDRIENMFKIDMAQFLQKTGFTQDRINIHEPVGCKACKGEGIRGRIGVFEVLENTKSVYEAILAGKSAKDIEQIAVAEGMLSMREDGLIKVLQGITTVDELIKAT